MDLISNYIILVLQGFFLLCAYYLIPSFNHHHHQSKTKLDAREGMKEAGIKMGLGCQEARLHEGKEGGLWRTPPSEFMNTEQLSPHPQELALGLLRQPCLCVWLLPI